ncbi:RtcB family protein [Methanobrevibacter sp.]|uniref:RtcB family protein n=1 Tax=Methanobrevibacter sp. TaxID=66852 RepID=UPI00388EAE67
MFELKGKYATAKVFSDDVDNDSISQVIQFLNQPIAEGQKIRMMPDIHAGIGCTIGTTMTISDKVVPNLVGSDIGCGMEVFYLDTNEIDFERLDGIIRSKVPYGYNRSVVPHHFMKDFDLTELRCYFKLEAGGEGNFYLGTLGGGNHFIEVNRTKDDELILVIHSGSRRIGADVCEHYQNQSLKEFKRFHNMASDKDMIYCEGKLFDDYIHDMGIMQDYASLNRKAIAETILSEYGMDYTKHFTTVHNYIDMDRMILRKGAVSADKGETLIIPINMREGSLICKGKGNPDWNYSAPHGAGRLYRRSQAKQMFSLDEFERAMEGIYSTSVGKDTLDESPMAYKPMSSIVENVAGSVDIVDVVKPVYNFKA